MKLKKIHDFSAQGSFWQVESENEQNLNIVTFIPLNGSSYIDLSNERSN